MDHVQTGEAQKVLSDHHATSLARHYDSKVIKVKGTLTEHEQEEGEHNQSSSKNREMEPSPRLDALLLRGEISPKRRFLPRVPRACEKSRVTLSNQVGHIRESEDSDNGS